MKIQLLSGLIISGTLLGTHPATTAPHSESTIRPAVIKRTLFRTTEQTNIQLAILLDTSSSMDGLIDQAKSQLWQIVNELATARYSGVQPKLQIALYEYGNDGLSSKNGYIRKVLPFTEDLDKVSEELFSLKTNGGNEYCGYVIGKAVSELEWTHSNNDLKIIYIAGNESFTQGDVDYHKACKDAISNGIVVNTVFCGDIQSGIDSKWKDGAELADGNYFNIDQNQSTVYVQTPWDDELIQLNNQLNGTYIAYGNDGDEKKKNMEEQDNNATTYGNGNVVARVNSKSSGFYNASTWDLVDASKNESFDLKKVNKEELPKEMQNMNEDERKKYVEQKSREREEIQKKITEINKKRNDYIAEQQQESGEQNGLGTAMKKSVQKLALDKNYSFEQ